MKKILITGANSYIGTSFEHYMEKFSTYKIDTLSVKEPDWPRFDFSPYDVVFHVAGIAHADVEKVSEETKKLYYEVNTDLTEKVAVKYKQDRKSQPSQFIFMSSIIVYGEGTQINKKRVIKPNDLPQPSNFYGDSKLQAELKIKPLETETFKVAILRPPMIYGPGSKGNYPELSKLAKRVPIFPKIKNERSMLFIGNLCMFIKYVIDEAANGVFFPQNNEYVQTSQLVKMIAEANGKKIVLVPGVDFFIFFLGLLPGKIGKLTNKAFGSLVYEKQGILSSFLNTEETIKITEGVRKSE